MENSSNNTIDLRRLFNLCRKHLKFLITCTIALALAGFIVSKFIMTPKYTATTQLLVNQKNENNAKTKTMPMVRPTIISRPTFRSSIPTRTSLPVQ